MATACWAFIVAKSTPVETASLLGFCGVARLQHENPSTSYAQIGAHRLWTTWRAAEVRGNSAPTQRFQPQLYRLDDLGREQMLGKWVPAYLSRVRPVGFHGSDMFASRTRFLPDEKTPTAHSAARSPRAGFEGTCNRRVESKPHLPISRSAGAAGRNRTCDPLLRREMLYPLSYSRASRPV
jgi:hypothetical protein